jgi:uncharacterized protein YdcH (DUF465 family)
MMLAEAVTEGTIWEEDWVMIVTWVLGGLGAIAVLWFLGWLIFYLPWERRGWVNDRLADLRSNVRQLTRDAEHKNKSTDDNFRRLFDVVNEHEKKIEGYDKVLSAASEALDRLIEERLKAPLPPPPPDTQGDSY